MGLLRRLLPLAALLACAAPAAADGYISVNGYDYKPFSEIRLDGTNEDGSHPIDDTIALLPNSSLKGTLSRISALVRRPQVRAVDGAVDDLDDNETPFAEVPTSFKRAYSLALQDLEADLNSAWSELDAITQREERSVLLQLVSYVALEPGVRWYGDFLAIGCGASNGQPFPCDPSMDDADEQLLDDLELVSQLVAVTLLEIVDAANAQCTDNCSDYLDTLDGRSPSSIYSQEMVNAMNELNYVHGEPIIDYLKRATGVPSIDD